MLHSGRTAATSITDLGGLRDAIVVRLEGGLGNQMFQYAAGLAVARRLGCALKLDTSWFAGVPDRAYMLDAWSIAEAETTADEFALLAAHMPRLRNRLTKRALSLLDRVRPVLQPVQIVQQSGYHYDRAVLSCSAPALLIGYFQSELFFSAIAGEVRAVFRPREPLSAVSLAMQQAIASTDWPVALHVRRGDYVANANFHAFHGTTSPEYYRHAIRIIDALSDGRAHYFVFSDDPAAAMDVLAGIDRCTIVTGNADRPWEDMTLMASCRSNVIANSSFSWWGAWLNPHPDKTVLAPRRWFQPDALLINNTRDLIPDGWITL